MFGTCELAGSKDDAGTIKLKKEKTELCVTLLLNLSLVHQKVYDKLSGK